MKIELVCANSDSVNRYGFMVHVTALEKSLKEVFDKGMPFLIGHDFHRPIGWSIPFGLFIESHLARMITRKVIATSDEDLLTIQRSVQSFLGKHYSERFSVMGVGFLSSISSFLSGKEQKIDTGCIAVIDENIAYKIYRDLFENADDDGLIPIEVLLKDFKYLSQGVFEHKVSKLCLFAHEFFRRSQSRHNNFHFFFLDAFLALSDSPDCTLKIRLDRHMVGFGPSFKARGELDFHYGPQYSDDISQIKTGIARYQCNDSDRRFYGISGTEFYWKKDKQEMTFELEELRDNPSPNLEEKYRCRYVHSIYKTDTEDFVHFDGAMRSYTLEEISDRLDKTFTEYGRKAEYKKLFRIDGKIPLDQWKALITHYMQGNPLIYEYFGLKEKIDSFRIKEQQLSAYEELLPFDIDKTEGIKLMFSYHTLPDNKKSGRYVDVYDVMSTDDSKIYCLELPIMEVKNAFRLAGEEFEMQETVKYIKFDDLYWNIPSIMHGGKDAEKQLRKTVEIMLSLFKSISNKGGQFIISLTLSFEFLGRLVRISSYGHIEHQIKWLEENFPFEFTEAGITHWVEKQRSYLNKFTTNINTVLIRGLLQDDGILFIKRIHVAYPYKYEMDDKGLKTVISFPENDDEILSLINEKKVKPVVCTQVDEALWSDTKENYLTAIRSKWLQETTANVEIHQASPLVLYWSKPY